MTHATATGTPTVPDTTELDHIEVWVFDLDNTLYPSTCHLFDQVNRRIGQFIARYLELPLAEARVVQKRFFREHGTTLRGLMTVHGMAPAAYLDFVHDIDLSPIEPSPALNAALHGLEGRKVVFTNGSEKHAETVMNRLGIADHFEAVFDIVAADYVPKPDPRPYREMIARFGFEPRAGAMVEDMAKNLKPAHDMGMTTVWVPGEAAWSHEESAGDHIHHVADDLVLWLAGIGRAHRIRSAATVDTP